MTDDELAAIKARCDAATPGPWFVAKKDCQGRYIQGYNTHICYRGDLCIVDHDDDAHPIVPIISNSWTIESNPSFVNNETRQFIAKARSDIPALLSHVEAQAARIKALEMRVQKESEERRLRV